MTYLTPAMLAEVKREMDAINPVDWLLTVIAAIPYAVGWAVGAIFRLLLFVVAAIIAGYKAGRGAQ